MFFRNTAATISDEAGFTARAVADQLGQSRPSMTQGVYLAGRQPTGSQRARSKQRSKIPSHKELHKPTPFRLIDPTQASIFK